jgi:flagellar biosynthesis protein FlhG
MDQAERLRRIVQSNIKQADPTAARVITVTSGKGGVGKTNTAVNLAIQFQKAGKRVVILDADFGMANIEVMFGAIPKYNLTDMVHKGMSLKSIVAEGPMGIGFISGGSGVAELVDLGKDQLQYLIQRLRELDEMADIILIDTGAGIGNTVVEFLTASSEIVVVTTPEPTSITDSYSLLKTLDRTPGFLEKKAKVYFLANRVGSENEGKALFQNLSVVVNKFLSLQLEYLGMVPQDEAIVRAVMQQSPVSIKAPGSRSSKAFEGLAHRLLEEPVEETGKTGGIAAFLMRLLKKS